MSDNSAINVLSQGLLGLLPNTVFTGIIKGLKDEKGVIVTNEDLTRWCNLPVSRSCIPAMGFTGGAVPAPMTTSTAAVKKGGKAAVTKVPVQPLLNPDGTPQTSSGKPFVEGKTCRHFYEKGAVNAGKYCGKDVVANTCYCSNKAHKDKENKAVVRPGIAPTVEVAKLENDEDGQLHVEVYDLSRNLHRELFNNFIVKQENELEPVYVLGKLNNITNDIDPLTDGEKIIAKKLELELASDELISRENINNKQIPSGVQQIPSGVQQIPSGVKQIPSGVQQIPSGVQQIPSGVQQIPSGVQQIPSGVQQIPSGVQQIPSGVPQIPSGVQQIPSGVQQIPSGVPQTVRPQIPSFPSNK